MWALRQSGYFMRQKRRVRALAAGVAVAALFSATTAQAIQVTQNNDGDILADRLFLNTPDLTITGTTVSGDSAQFGTFTNQSGTYGLPAQGIVLSTGNVEDYSDGPNFDSGNTTGFGNSATPDQEALLDPITGGDFDHNDVRAADHRIRRRSGCDQRDVLRHLSDREEFPEFVGSSFVDGFGLFVNGTNVAFARGLPINIDHPDFLGAARVRATARASFPATVSRATTSRTVEFFVLANEEIGDGPDGPDGPGR